jgi:hypothetical protein
MQRLVFPEDQTAKNYMLTQKMAKRGKLKPAGYAATS